MNGSQATPSERSITGLLFVDKPAGSTSHDVVGVVRRAARTKRVGHAGTLDPFATGLLVIAIGPCTRLLPYLNSEPKVYDAVIHFGSETNTDDRTGVVTREAALPDMSGLPVAVAALTGTMAQVPPAFSAKHVHGQRAYDLARRGDVVDIPANDVTIHHWEIGDVTHDTVHARITCAGGTYIRALARDLGREMQSAAHCRALRRVRSGAANIAIATPYTALMPGAIADGLVTLHAPLALLAPMVHVELDDDGLTALSHGRTIAAGYETAHAEAHTWSRAALLRDGQVLAIAERAPENRWQPRVVLSESAGA